MFKILSLILLLISFQSFAQQLSDMIPKPFHAVESNNQVMNIDSGFAALQLRIDMIRRAKKTIELEYFIFNTDLAGKIIVRELVKASQERNVKVRILIDKSMPIFQLDEFYAKELAKYKIDVRYYNAAPLYYISTINFRNHRKLLVIDDKEALTGGRNVGDDYYDLSHEFNFNDRDIYVRGSIVKTMRESFDKFFDHKITEKPKFPKKPSNFADPSFQKAYKKKTEKAQLFLKYTNKEKEVRERLNQWGPFLLGMNKLHNCPTLTFSSDAPGANFIERLSPQFDEKFKFLRKTLHDKISVVDKSLLISSPYILSHKKSLELFTLLRSRGVDIDIYTNSLASTDAIYVAANLYKDIRKWAKLGVDIYLHDGRWLGETPDAPEGVRRAKWGSHCKSQVYETSEYSEVMIGTYNVDNRSNFYNTEMALFCKGNDEFTEEVRSGIMKRASQGVKIQPNGSATNSKGEFVSIYGASEKDLRLMKLISIPSWLLKFLL